MALDPDVQLAIDHAHDLIVWERLRPPNCWTHITGALYLAAREMADEEGQERPDIIALLAIQPVAAAADWSAPPYARNDVLAALCRAREG